MLDYNYRSYFYDQSHKKNILIVSQTCTVTARSGKAPRVDTSNAENPVVITNDDIIREEFEIDEALNSADNLSFGTCEAGLIKFTIRHSRRIPFLNEISETKAHSEIVKLYFYFDDDSSTLMYYGMYICQRDELSDNGDTRSIECVDLVSMLRDFDIYEWYKWKFLNLEPEDISGQGDAPDPSSDSDEPIPEPKEMTIKQIRDAMFNFINGDEEVPPEIPLDFYVPIQQDDVTLPNDNWKFKYRVTTEKLSFMQMLEDICEINGTFGHIGRKLITATDRCVFEYVTLPRYDVEIDNWNKIRNNYATRNFKHDYFITKGIRTLTIYNNEAKEIARYEKGIPVDDQGNKNYNAYSEYIIYDNKFIDDVEDDSEEAESYTTMLKNIYGSIRYRTYTPYEITVQADLCREIGDRIGIVNDFDPYDNKDLSKEKFKTYILEKVTKGIQNMTDTYTAKGDRVIPKFGDSSSSSGYYSYTGGGYTVSSNPGSGSTTDANEGNVVNAGITTPEDLIEYIRNFGIRLLAEPKVEYVMTDEGPSFRWEDPADISNNRPCPAAWAGTVIVRKKGSAPRNRWDFKSATGGLLVDSTTRDEYKDDPIVDDGSVLPARNQSFDYYYGIFPYDTEGHYRFTKIVKVKRQSVNAPNITGISQNGVNVTVNFIIPNASYEYIKLVYKKDRIPESSLDGTAVNLQQSDTSKTVNIDFGSGEYYFVIFTKNSNGNEAESNVMVCSIGNYPNTIILYDNGVVGSFFDTNATITYTDVVGSIDPDTKLTVNGSDMTIVSKTPSQGRSVTIVVDFDAVKLPQAYSKMRMKYTLGVVQGGNYTNSHIWINGAVGNNDVIIASNFAGGIYVPSGMEGSIGDGSRSHSSINHIDEPKNLLFDVNNQPHTSFRVHSQNGNCITTLTIHEIQVYKDDVEWQDFFDLVSNTDITDYFNSSGESFPSQYWDSEKIVMYGQSGRHMISSIADNVIKWSDWSEYTGTYVSFPLSQPKNVYGIEVTVSMAGSGSYHSGNWSWAFIRGQYKDDNGTIHNTPDAGFEHSNNFPEMEKINVGETKTSIIYFDKVYANCERIDINYSYGVWELSNIKILTV